MIDEDEQMARIARRMSIGLFLVGLLVYMWSIFGMHELVHAERQAMRFIAALVSAFGWHFVDWRPTHEGDDYD